MGEIVVLRIRYNQSKYVEIQVDDLDESNLLDLFVGLVEGAIKIVMILPENPTLWYANGSQNFQLKRDDDLMKMF